MTGRELFNIMKNGDMPQRIPFIPSIYEHSARVINKKPSEVAVDEDLIVESQLTSYEIYRHDLISVGLDIYNVECEALGAKVYFPENDEIPSLSEVLIKSKKDLDRLTLPDPEKDGRMPLFINAAQRISNIIGKEVIVNGTVVGPFTLAALMRGFEDFIMDLITDYDFAKELMLFAKKVGLVFAKAFIERGMGLSINESWISPPLLSPDLYRKYVYPVEKDMVTDIKKMGLDNVAIISGGDTTEIAQYLAETGSSLLMADYNTDQKYYKEICSEKDIFLRASIETKLVESGTEVELKEAVQGVINTCGDYSRFIFGCGVVSYNTSVDRVLLLKKMVEE
jgi:uroporphyrinogen decarboxylase